jgi:hypothetical protein
MALPLAPQNPPGAEAGTYSHSRTEHGALGLGALIYHKTVRAGAENGSPPDAQLSLCAFGFFFFLIFLVMVHCEKILAYSFLN